LSKEDILKATLVVRVAYGLAILPLIHYLKDEVPDIHQPWYADNAGV
jgi:hypothetical protein